MDVIPQYELPSADRDDLLPALTGMRTNRVEMAAAACDAKSCDKEKLRHSQPYKSFARAEADPK
jgi:hypothetical protein